MREKLLYFKERLHGDKIFLMNVLKFLTRDNLFSI